jgi:spore maturation protein CgeB
MKIFYCAVFDNIGYAADNSKFRELQEADNSVVCYNYRVRGLELERNRFVSRKRDEEIFNFCQNWQPDFIIFSKCNGIDNNLFKKLKEIAPLCYWFADPLVTYSNYEFYEKTKIADFFICDKINVLEKAKEFNDNCFLVTDGFDSLLEFPKDVPKKYEVSFIGNLYGDRKEKINKIIHKVDIITGAYGSDHSLRVSESKINLNVCTTAGQSDRVFKVLAAGGFLITDDWPDREKFFKDGQDIVIFKDYDHLNELIDYYLKNDSEREKIALQGNKTVQKYTRKNWVKNTLQILKNLNIKREKPPKKETVLLAGPWVGEFGWELFCWHAYLRSLSEFYDKVICVSTKYSKFLYEDFCNQFIEFTPQSGDYKDSFYKVGFDITSKLITELIGKTKLNLGESKLSLLLPRRIGDPPRTHFTEKFQFGPLFVSPKYLKYGKKDTLYDNTVVIHARNRDLRPEDNWSEKKWKKLVDKLKETCYTIISIGLKSQAMHIEGTVDKRECDQQELLNILHSSKATFGPSSGAMCLAILCDCPLVVWTTDYNYDRFTKNWNPHNTDVLFLSEYGWQPEPEYVYEKFLEWIK